MVPCTEQIGNSLIHIQPATTFEGHGINFLGKFIFKLGEQATRTFPNGSFKHPNRTAFGVLKHKGR